MNSPTPATEFWRARLNVPSYPVGQAARYAKISTGKVRDWHKISNRKPLLGRRETGLALSYFQLIELAVVASARASGVSLQAIRDARDYCARVLKINHPFAHLRFKTDGSNLLLELDDVDPKTVRSGKMIVANSFGQLAWKEIIGRLKEFDYDKNNLATRWFVAGRDSKVIIDPRIAFGAPSVGGVPTSVIASRIAAGEEREYIADDFGLHVSLVQEALLFESPEERFH